MGCTALAKRIVSSAPHVAPRKSVVTCVITCAAPPAAGIFLSVPSAKKPTQRLSGDQNGSWASSVPANCPAYALSIDRIHSVGLAPGVSALKTSVWPSGETANEGTLTVVLTLDAKAVFSGGDTAKLIRSPDDVVVDRREARNSPVKTSVVTRNSAAAIHAAHSR